MTACPSASGHLNPAFGQIKIIMEDKQMLSSDIEIIEKGAHTLSGAIHIGLRFHSIHLVARQTALAVQALQLATPQMPALPFRKGL